MEGVKSQKPSRQGPSKRNERGDSGEENEYPVRSNHGGAKFHPCLDEKMKTTIITGLSPRKGATKVTTIRIDRR